MLIIGSQDAVWGFALVGVRGEIVTTEEEVHRALDAAMDSEDVGIVLITEDVSALARDRVDTLKVRSMHPLLVEIPGPEGPHADRPPINEVIRRTIGVRV
ncbi:MAG: V-type ATP synthase subunit F [Chloroflexota bacterium]|nr:V-type ATP synthase subunit F [Chloroflexota bacterium]